MMNTALNAIPLSYSKTLQPFRAGDVSTFTTGLGSVSLVSFDIHRLPSGKFVPQHIPERRPTRIKNGFSHSGFREFCCVHIADNDQTVCISLLLCCDAEVPHLIAGYSVSVEMFTACRVLDSISEGDDAHRGSQAVDTSLDQERVTGLPSGGAFALFTIAITTMQICMPTYGWPS